MTQSQALIGVDWGTHSSKWTWTLLDSDSRRQPFGQFFKILRSDVRVDEPSERVFLSVDNPPTGSIHEFSLKGTLIRDPYGPFWEGRRARSRLTLGELVSFSLWFLVSEAYQNLKATLDIEPDLLEVRFSLPNWVSIEGAAAARSNYAQAARVACRIFDGDREAWARDSQPPRSAWHASVQEALKDLEISDESQMTADTKDFATLLKQSFEVSPEMTFRFVAESSAAGLTGLRDVEGELEGRRFLRKLLVIDIGAGSTDIGYVLRTIPQGPATANEALIQLPPANTCRVAGEELSRAIVEIYRVRGTKISGDEAETLKITGDQSEWVNQPSVSAWRETIAEHVRSYVEDISDRRWLPEQPGLQVLLTGGSAVVPGLGEKILDVVKSALTQRGFDDSVVRLTALMTLSLRGSAAADANRLAVALGAASEEFPSLNYYPELDPAMPHQTVRRTPGWTG